MILDRAGGLHSLLVAIQITLTLWWYVVLVFVFHRREHLEMERYALYGLVVAAALVFDYLRRDRGAIRACMFERNLLSLHPIAMQQTGTVLLAVVLFVALLKDPTLSRGFLICFLLTLYPLLLFTSWKLPGWLAHCSFRGLREHKTLLVGTSLEVPRLKLWMERRAHLGFSTIGVLSDEETGDTVHGLPVLGSTEDLERVLRDDGVSQVIVLGLPLVLHRYSHVVRICNRYGVRLAIYSDLPERLKHALTYRVDDGLHFMALRQEPLENLLNRLLKRLLDMAIALPVVVLILPIAAAVVRCAQRAQAPGSLLHRQKRAGLQNCPFEILKFRTMYDAAHDITQAASARDERIFPAGRWLRKLSIDELPQFVNVLRGEMSVVGPRPHLVEHNRDFARLLEAYHIRAFVRPGITGLAQVRGYRGEATPEAIAARLDSDTFYLENWSFALDLGIIVRTALQVLVPPRTAR